MSAYFTGSWNWGKFAHFAFLVQVQRNAIQVTLQLSRPFWSVLSIPLHACSLLYFPVHWQPLMREMCNQVDQVRLMLEKMAVRVALLEIQVKKLEGSSSMQLAESKCNSEEQCLLVKNISMYIRSQFLRPQWQRMALWTAMVSLPHIHIKLTPLAAPTLTCIPSNHL